MSDELRDLSVAGSDHYGASISIVTLIISGCDPVSMPANVSGGGQKGLEWSGPALRDLRYHFLTFDEFVYLCLNLVTVRAYMATQ